MKIIISDFDNTFFTENYINNIDYINSFVNKGNLFIIATGRSFESLNTEIKDYNIKYSYLICSDGSAIYDNKNIPIYVNEIDKHCVKESCLFINSNQGVYEAITEKVNNKVNSIVATIKNREQAQLLVSEIKEKLPLNVYLSEKHINVRNLNITKLSGILFLINQYNLNSENIYTIGDGVNDIEMCNAFKSITFDYGNEALKNICNYIVLDFIAGVKKIETLF